MCCPLLFENFNVFWELRRTKKTGFCPCEIGQLTKDNPFAEFMQVDFGQNMLKRHTLCPLGDEKRIFSGKYADNEYIEKIAKPPLFFGNVIITTEPRHA